VIVASTVAGGSVAAVVGASVAAVVGASVTGAEVAGAAVAGAWVGVAAGAQADKIKAAMIRVVKKLRVLVISFSFFLVD
jgi:hypothetical protein